MKFLLKTQTIAAIAYIAVFCLSACSKSENSASNTNQSPTSEQEINTINTTVQNTNQPQTEQPQRETEADITEKADVEPPKETADAEPPKETADAEPQAEVAQKPATVVNDRIFQIENVDELKALIAEGVDVNTKDDEFGQTVLFDIDLDFVEDYHDYTKAIEIAKILIDAGIDINAKNKEGKTVLFEITHTKSAVPYIKLLLDHGADPKIIANDGTTVLFAATDKKSYGADCSPEIVKLMIDAGADIHAKNKNGQTYLEAADDGCRNKIASTLDSATTISLSDKDIKNILSSMNVKPGNVNKPDDDGNTPLFYVNSQKEVAALIASGADVNHQNKDKETPLFWIAQFAKDPSCVKAVISAGANPNHVNDEGKTPIFYANHIDMIRALAKGGADIYYTHESSYGYDEHDEERAIDHIKEVLKKDFVFANDPKALQKAIDELDADMRVARGLPARDNPKPEPDVTNSVAVKEEPKFEETVIPPTPGDLTCLKSENALFVDGTELYYKIQIEQSADGLAEDESKFEFYVLCRADLNYVSEIYCGSSVNCELEPKYNNEINKSIIDPGLPVEGTWFIDTNGIYHMDKGEFQNLIKTTNTRRGKAYKYIEFKPGTLAWEYKPFKDIEPMFPLRPDIKVYDVNKSAGSKETVSRTGTVLCHHFALEGDNPAVDDLCIDDTKGPSSFKKVRGGAVDFFMKGTLKTKKK